MRISVLQENLQKGLSLVSRAIESRPTMPVLSNVLLKTEDARLKLVAVNMSLGLGITCWIGAKVETEGAITLPAKTFADLVNNLSQERVDLTLDVATQTVNLRCGATKANIKGIDANEFPPTTEGEGGDVMIPGKILKEMINQTVFAAATEDNRPILTGLYTELDGNVLTLASADGYRLAVRTAEIDQTFPNPVVMVIPAKAMAEVARAISDDDTDVMITLPTSLGRDHVLFQTSNVLISSQLLEGKFPDFSAIIPRKYSTKTIVYTSDLLRACQRAEIFARDTAYSGRIFLKPPKAPGEPGEVMVTGRSAERGDNEGIVDATIEGEPLDIVFNIKYLIEVLRVVNQERVEIESNGAANPGVLRPEGRDDFTYVIMPMNVPR
ncbi:MAG TPA: DNA polymerase III subunit beta [Phototrophicaceae bacterium]|jgi:DNA polymerase-3 subunit beta|nr:DNA polymerase III subunit beta [Phototrophicaceae bacterium]